MRNAVAIYFELVGLLVLAVAGAFAVLPYSLAGAIGTGGLLLIAAAALIVRSTPKAELRRGPITIEDTVK